MGKIKLTKGELKRQRDALKQYQRYLPTLQLKKQQLQMEILYQVASIEKQRQEEKAKQDSIDSCQRFPMLGTLEWVMVPFW